MEDHVTVVGIIRIGLGVLGVAGAFVLVAILIAAGVASTYYTDEVVFPYLAAAAAGIGGGLLLSSLPGVIGGIGLLRHKNWARYLVLVLAVFDLLAFPLGTALGIYSIWVLTSRRTVPLFVGAGPGTRAAAESA